MPPVVAGQAYAQLVTAENPPPNLVLSSAQEPLASQGRSQMIEGIAMAENAQSALPFGVV